MSLKKITGIIHLWLGLTSGLVVFILGITGCIYCFEKELKDTFYSGRIFLDAKTQKPLSLDTLTLIAQEALGKDKPVNRIEIQPNSDRTYIFSAQKFNEDALIYKDQYEYNHAVYVNPFTGKVQYTEDRELEFFSLVFALHYDLLLGKIGHVIVPWATAIFVMMLVTGIILWWPKNRSAAKQRFWFKWKENTKWKRKNYDLHNIPGFYAMLIALVIALTGLVFGFEWAHKSLKFIANAGKEIPESKPAMSDTLQINLTARYQDIYDLTLKQEIGVQRLLFILPEEKQGTISIRSYDNMDNSIGQNILAFDRYTGKLLEIKPYQKRSAGEKVSMANYDVHIGKILGLPGMMVAFIGSLVSASLPVTGFMIWRGRRKQSKK